MVGSNESREERAVSTDARVRQNTRAIRGRGSLDEFGDEDTQEEEGLRGHAHRNQMPPTKPALG